MFPKTKRRILRLTAVWDCIKCSIQNTVHLLLYDHPGEDNEEAKKAKEEEKAAAKAKRKAEKEAILLQEKREEEER